jgi:UDP-N-acetylglucosamine 2-epimerase (non-hydrolysing)
LKAVQPDLVVVHGDTSTSAAVAISSYLNNFPVAHVEAGLRSGDILSPFPEEGNRRIIDGISTLHFPPTQLSAQNVAEELHLKSHMVFGNTIVDAVRSATSDTNFEFSQNFEGELRQILKGKYILVTQHRRESFGPGIRQVFEAIAALADHILPVIFPVHPNPNVRAIAMEVFSDCSGAHLIEPVEYLDMINLISRATIVISDSGGIQEECAILGKPVLITRNVTERPEVIQSGNGVLVGTDKDLIYSTAARILSDNDLLLSMSKKSHLFGDGESSLRIFKVMEGFLGKA